MPQQPDTTDIRNTLELNTSKVERPYRRWLYILGAIVVITLLIAGYFRYASKQTQIAYETRPAVVGSLSITVSATGNLAPTNSVNVGTEISGTVKAVYVDDNDPVKKGELLAVLDTTKLQTKVESASAALRAARAALEEADVALADARNELKRAKELRASSGGRLPSDKEFDALKTAYERALARRESARAQVSQARSALGADEDDLAKASIVSPIDGIILVRTIEPGQTVAATLQTPVLFTIAENLTQMELVVSVDEADIGSVREGQQAEFTVDAYPERTFSAVIDKVKLNSKILEGVVTYESTLSVNNGALLLRPGMTATAEITVKTIDDALLVPNAALRYRPSTAKEEELKDGGAVWVLAEGVPKKVAVDVLGTDGKHTAVTADEALSALPVIVAEKSKASR